LLDAAVRAAASLTLELARTGGCSVLLPGMRQPLQVSGDLTAWPGVHTRLALVEGGTDQAPALRGRAAGGAIIYVAARLDPQAVVPTGTRMASAFLLVVPAALGERLSPAPSFEVSGCAGYLLQTRAVRARRRAA
jgi:hypothetical protein